VDYFCYAPEEFERLKNTSTILRDAVGNAIEVALWTYPVKTTGPFFTNGRRQVSLLGKNKGR
jgi:hypothetical protein